MNEPHPSAPAHPQAPKASPAAVWSLVLGILSITCLWILGSIPAIILGIKGMKKADADPENVGGKGIALSGLITGSVGIFIGITPIAIATAMLLPAVSGAQQRAYMIKEINNVRQCILGLQTFAADNNGKFPEKLMDLYPDYIDTDELVFASPGNGTGSAERLPLQYRSGLTTDSDFEEPIILSPTVYGRGKQVVGFIDGSVRDIGEPELSDIAPKFD